MIKTFHDVNPAEPPDHDSGTSGSSLFNPAANPPSALFPDAVQVAATIDPAWRTEVESAAARLEMADFRFQDAEISRIRQLTQSIRLDDPLYISEYGAEISRFSEQILNRLTDITQQRYPDLVRVHLVQILACVRRIDPESLLKPGLGKRLKSLFSRQVIDRDGFIQLERDMSAAVATCLQQLVLLKKSQQIFVDLFEKNELQFRGLTASVLAGELRLEAEKAELATQASLVNEDFFTRQSLIDRQEALDRFARRLHTLRILRQTVLLRIGQLRLEQKNMHALIDQADETINLVIPTWKQQVLALLSAAPNDSRDELYEQLDATQRLLTNKMLSLEQDTP